MSAELEKRYLIAGAITNAARDRSYRTGRDLYECYREVFEETWNIKSWPIKSPSSIHQAPIQHSQQNAMVAQVKMYLETARKYLFENPSVGYRCLKNVERIQAGLPPIEIY